MPTENSVETKKHTAASTKVLDCVCEHDYQDERYGQQKRLHNPMKGSVPGKAAYRCTVCGRETK